MSSPSPVFHDEAVSKRRPPFSLRGLWSAHCNTAILAALCYHLFLRSSYWHTAEGPHCNCSPPPRQGPGHCDETSEDWLDGYVELSADTVHHIGLNPITAVSADICRDRNDTLMIFVVCSQPKSFELRNLIRQTYGQFGVTLFFMGQPNTREEFYNLFKEHEKYEDIVEFDYENSYFNVTLKILAAFNWVERYCPQAEWIVKIDEDVFINPYEMEKILQNVPLQDVPSNETDAENPSSALGENSGNTSENGNNKVEETADIDGAGAPETSIVDAVPRSPMYDIVCSAAGTAVCRDTNECFMRYIEARRDYPAEEYPPFCAGHVFSVHRTFVTRALAADRIRYDKGIIRSRFDDIYVTGFLVEDLGAKILNMRERAVYYPRELTQDMMDGWTVTIERLEMHLPEGTFQWLWEHISEGRDEGRQGRRTSRGALVDIVL